MRTRPKPAPHKWPDSNASASASSSISPPRAVLITTASRGILAQRVAVDDFLGLGCVRGRCRLTMFDPRSSFIPARPVSRRAPLAELRDRW